MFTSYPCIWCTCRILGLVVLMLYASVLTPGLDNHTYVCIRVHCLPSYRMATDFINVRIP